MDDDSVRGGSSRPSSAAIGTGTGRDSCMQRDSDVGGVGPDPLDSEKLERQLMRALADDDLGRYPLL